MNETSNQTSIQTIRNDRQITTVILANNIRHVDKCQRIKLWSQLLPRILPNKLSFQFPDANSIVKRTVNTVLSYQTSTIKRSNTLSPWIVSRTSILYGEKRNLVILSPIAGETRTQLAVVKLKSNVNQNLANN